MTTQPEVPGAAAVYLLYEQINNENAHTTTVYVRVKVLTDAGKQYADVELPYDKSGGFSIRKIEGRTIHSDGTVIPFNSKPFDKLIAKAGHLRYNARVFTLPDVQVGSILEYRYELTYAPEWFIAPHWDIQQELFVRKAHYVFYPDQDDSLLANGSNTRSFAWVTQLPNGAQVNHIKSNYELWLDNVSPLADEDWMPPRNSLGYHVYFYYVNPLKITGKDATAAYWKNAGEVWSSGVDAFIDEGKLKPVAASLVAANDGDAQKVAKIYDAVTHVENTRGEREHSEKEDKAAKIRVNTAVDVWTHKRGTPFAITMLFVGLARAAGLKAWVMAVTDRDVQLFNRSTLDMDQLDDDIAIVVVNGKEEYFDPGEAFCPLEQLHWRHTITMGLRQSADGTKLAETPGQPATDAKTLREAQLTLDQTGQVHGQIVITMTGAPAIGWRELAANTDTTGMTKEFEDELRSHLPQGLTVKVTGFTGLTERESPLIANVEVSGPMGVRTGGRLFFPVNVLEAGTKPVFTSNQRETPVDLNYAYIDEDEVTLHWPAGMTLEAAPTPVQVKLTLAREQGRTVGLFQMKFQKDAQSWQASRVLALATPLFSKDEYTGLKQFYGTVNAKDQEQAVLHEEKETAARQ